MTFKLEQKFTAYQRENPAVYVISSLSVIFFWGGGDLVFLDPDPLTPV